MSDAEILDRIKEKYIELEVMHQISKQKVYDLINYNKNWTIDEHLYNLEKFLFRKIKGNK